MDIEIDAGMDKSEQLSKPVKRQSAKKQDELKKLRITLEEPEDGRLHSFMTKLRDRGIKSPDLGALISEALAELSDSWWEAKLEEMTPLEWKVQAALENPELREKLVSLLEGQ